jgi:RNA polymerase sigma-70 factor (ECF subfamily)
VHLDPSTVDALFRKSGAAQWELPRDVFGDVLAASARHAYPDRSPSPREIDTYLGSLHLADLALACACARGSEPAWEHFMRELRPPLYRAADALDPSGGVREIADALYAELYGIRDGEDRRSLLRYYHGRSSLATWLRAVLVQRHIDSLRSRRRLEPLPDTDAAAPSVAAQSADPDRRRLVALVEDALQHAIQALDARDRLRLRSYYTVELTLAQIGRVTGEHEATVSRNLSRTRRVLRESVEQRLRSASGLNAEQVARALELAMADPGAMDLRRMMPAEGKESAVDRSR